MKGDVILLSVVIVILSVSISCNAWLLTTTHHIVGRHQCFELHARTKQNERYHCGEVIGSTGKIGSYILDSINSHAVPVVESNDDQYPQCQPVAATPRGVSPGCLSPENTPLYACIPSSSIQTVWNATVPHRRKDLVFLCNCIPSRHLTFDSSSDCTICILHFGVSHKNTNAGTTKSSQPLPILNTSPQSPATVVFGRHATTLANVLKRDGISVEIASSAQHIQLVAAKKLAWSSLFWLLCHDGSEPMTVKEIWDKKSTQIYALVDEMIPALERLASEPWTTQSGAEQSNQPTKMKPIGTVQEVVDYLYAYSMSMKNGQITPSLELGLNEIQERNGVLLSLLMQSNANEAHLPKLQLEMIQRVAGDKYLEQCLATATVTSDCDDGSNCLERIACRASNLQFLYYPAKKHIPLTGSPSIIIIGAGIIGSSLAHHLSRRGDIKLTILDKSTNLLPTDQDNEIYPGVATSSSFAWLNANDKSPLSYMQLNQLGMEMWRRHDMLNKYPVWCGSLIKKAKQVIHEKNSRYVTVGPLDNDDAKNLEPSLQFEDRSAEKSSEVYFYPEEGFVEPIKVVKDMRLSAQSNGANFIGGAEVVGLIRREDGHITGVKYTTTNDSNDIKRLDADLVIVACGANSASPALGVGPEKLPLDTQPGALTYVSNGSYLNQDLSRIFVDTIHETHMLRRSDGTLVIGGGKLIVGGSGSDGDLPDSRDTDTSLIQEADSVIGKKMIESAMKSISSDKLESFTESCSENDDMHFRVTQANRPIAADGLPVVGFVEQGLYVAVTHSGVTLAPLIGELASYEIEESLITTRISDDSRYGFEILDAYRPTRFTPSSR